MSIFLIVVNAASFLVYGMLCFLSDATAKEFNRYGFGSQRKMIGGLQLAASIGLLAGLSQHWIGQAASGGLALLMLAGVGVRIGIKDSFFQTLPALFYLFLNVYLFWTWL